MSSSIITVMTTEMTAPRHNTTFSSALPDLEAGIPWQRILMGVVLYLLVFVTVAGNALVLVAVATDKRLQTVFNVFIVNLAFTDICVGLIAMNFFAAFNIIQSWPFGEVLCGLWIFGDFGMTFASIFTLLAISLDRYWSVHWGVNYRIHNNRRKAIVATTAIWSATLLLWVPAFVVDRFNNSRPGECFYDPEKNRVFVTIVAVLGYHSSTIVMLFCYVKVFLFVRRRGKVGPLARTRRGARETSVTESAVSTRPTDRSHVVDDDTLRCDVSNSDRRSLETNLAMSVVEEPSTLHNPQFLCPGDTRRGKSREPVADHNVDKNDFENVDASEATSSTTTEQTQSSNQTTATTFRNQPQDTTASNEQSNSSAARTLRHEQKVFLTLTYIIVGYMICWMPFHVSFDIMAIDRTLVPEQWYDVTYWLAYCNSAINPFLYNFGSPDFHKAFRKLLGRKI